MAMTNPKGRTNYEPNSRGANGGPREDPRTGFVSFPAEEAGPKLRVRPELFADHYSQARQFYISQTEVEQKHIADALTFELSKVESPATRARVVSHLRNIDDELAQSVADGLGLPALPDPAEAAKPTRTDLEPSPALSILMNGPDSFQGRKLGVLLTDGADAGLFNALHRAFEAEQAIIEVIAPLVGGVALSDGTKVAAKQQLKGGPSVLYDAVAIIASAEGAEQLAKMPAARDFVADAFAHCKFIGYVASAAPLFSKAGIEQELDEGVIKLDDVQSVEPFVERCAELRFWHREPA